MARAGAARVPGSSDPQPGPESEDELETFLAEAIEAYAEASEGFRKSLQAFLASAGEADVAAMLASTDA